MQPVEAVVFAFGLYLVAAVFVLATLLRERDLSFGGITLGMIVCAAAVQVLATRLKKTQLAVCIGVGLAILMMAAVRLSGLGWGPCFIAMAVVVLAVMMTVGHPGYLQAVVAGTIPCTALILALLMRSEGPAGWIPIDIMLWSLAAWPALALMSSGRRWALTASLGVVGLLVVVHRLLSGVDAGAVHLIQIGSVDTSRREGMLAIGQTALVVASVGPHLLLSAARWRWTAVVGVMFIVGPLSLVFMTGPWANGWPSLVWWFVLPGCLCLVVGIIGMLCTARQPEQLAENAVRTMALGIGATATLLLPLVHQAVDGREMISALATASAPLVWGLGLALVLSVTGLIARRHETGFNTTTLFRMKVRPRFRASMLAFGRQIGGDLRAETKQWWTPRGIVPLVVLAATWPAFERLGGQVAMVPLITAVAVFASGLARVALSLWTAAMALLLALAGMCLGLDLASAIAAAAVGVAASWPFVRWNTLNTAWTFCAGLLVQAMLWDAFAGTPEDLLVVALALGISVLVTNALAPTGARWLILATTAAWLFVFLAHWIPHQDPYFPLLLKGQQLWGEAGYLLLRLPLMALVLTTLWVSRHRVVHRHWCSPAWQRILMAVVGVGAAVTWAVGGGDVLVVGLLAWVALIVVARPVARELTDQSGIDDREPLVDALSLVVAILIVTAGHATALVREAGLDTEGSGLVEPGTMGVILIDAIRDLVALAATVVALILVSGMRQGSRFVSSGREAVHQLATSMYRATEVFTNRHTSK